MILVITQFCVFCEYSYMYLRVLLLLANSFLNNVRFHIPWVNCYQNNKETMKWT